MTITRKEGKNLNKAFFTDLRSHLMQVLLSDDKIGVAPTVEIHVPKPLKVKCLRCGFMFHGNVYKRICQTCRNYNKELV